MTNETKQATHTPGPWAIEAWNEHAGSFGITATVHGHTNNVTLVHPNVYLDADVATATANARLIAAAPDLLEAAQTILRVASSQYSRSKAETCPHGNLPSYPAHAWWCDDCWNALAAAVAKATGAQS